MRHVLGCVVLLFATSGCISTLSAAEKKKDPVLEAEEKEAAEEDAEAVGKDTQSGYEFTARGKLALSNMDDTQKPLVIGLFAADGRVYSVKVERDELRAQLRAYDGKSVGLAGKIRNKGKYFVVQEIADGVPAPDALRNPRGL